MSASNVRSIFNILINAALALDYNDINHLSEHEFYGKLDGLKRKQAELNEACCLRRCADNGTGDIPPILECDEPASSATSVRKHSRRLVRSKSASPFRMTQR